MDFVMNEEKYAERLLNERCDIDFKSRTYAITVIAKYYRTLGYDDKAVERDVELFIGERFPNVSKKSVDFWLKRAVTVSKKYPLLKIDNINVTDKEMDIIDALHSDKFKTDKLQRLAFAFLCFSKFEAAKGRKDGWVNTDRKYIFQAADLRNIKNDKQLLYIHELCKLGYVDISLKIGSGGIKVLGNAEGTPEIAVGDMNEVGYIFEEYEGRRFIKCYICGKRVPVTNGRSIYCRSCAENVNREKTRERMKKALNF